MNLTDIKELDSIDPFALHREQFQLPVNKVYLDGNSLGAMTKGTATRLQQVIQQQLADATQSTSAQQNENDSLRQQFSELQSQNNRLTKQLKTLEEQNADFSQKLDAADQTAKMQWFTRGGIVALISLILGVIVAYLPKKRRKSDTWM